MKLLIYLSHTFLCVLTKPICIGSTVFVYLFKTKEEDGKHLRFPLVTFNSPDCGCCCFSCVDEFCCLDWPIRLDWPALMSWIKDRRSTVDPWALWWIPFMRLQLLNDRHGLSVSHVTVIVALSSLFFHLMKTPILFNLDTAPHTFICRSFFLVFHGPSLFSVDSNSFLLHKTLVSNENHQRKSERARERERERATQHRLDWMSNSLFFWSDLGITQDGVQSRFCVGWMFQVLKDPDWLLLFCLCQNVDFSCPCKQVKACAPFFSPISSPSLSRLDYYSPSATRGWPATISPLPY